MTRGPLPLKEKSLRVWRAIAEAGIDGIGSSPLYDQFRSEFTQVEISSALQTLTVGGYAERTGANRYGVWKITEACKMPKGEYAPAWLAAAAQAKSDAADALEDALEAAERRKAVTVTIPAAPASVFNLGDQPLVVALERAKGIVERTLHAPTAKPESRVELNWKAPVLPAPAEAQEAEVAHAEPAAAAPAPEVDRFTCYVDNEGAMYLCNAFGEINLPLAHTRKLMHYLDRIGVDELIESIDDEVPA